MQSEMKALVGGIQKFSTEDGPGIRTTVFLKGCPLNCKWCHNPELIDFRQQVIQMPNNCIKCGYCTTHCPMDAIFATEKGEIKIDREKCNRCMECINFCTANAIRAVAEEMTPEEVIRKVEQDVEFYRQTGGGMTISGGEMLSQPEFSEALIELAEEKGIGVCLDTSGHGDIDALVKLASHKNVTDILFDLKSIDPDVHEAYTGVDNKLILENLRRLAEDPELAPKLLMRMPLVKGINDGEEIIEKTVELYKELKLGRVTLLPYHILGVSKKRHIGETPEEFSPPSDERIEEIKTAFETKAGMKVEILGKV